MRRVNLFLLLIAISCSLTACSPKKMGISRMADALTATASAYSRDDDPEFVRLAAPSTLKMVEMLLDEAPANEGLLLSACSGFSQYAFGFLQVDSEIAEATSVAQARELRARAAAMYERSRRYCVRALEIRHAGIGPRLNRDPKPALRAATVADVPALYWLGVAWGGALSLSDNQLARLGEIVGVRAVFTRALELDERWESGALHEAMIAVEGLPALVGGSPARAKDHFDKAVSMSNGESAFAFVTLATSVALPAKNRGEFERLLRAALAIEPARRPSLRLANLIAQKRARFLLSRADRLF